MITYKTFMIKTYSEKDTFYGDLAKDIKLDDSFPNYIKLEKIEKYLSDNSACNVAMKCFYETYALYIDKCADYHYSDCEQIEIMHKLLKKYYENCSENMLTNILKRLNDISGDKKKINK